MKTQIEVAIAYGLCTCDEDYINRGLTAPDCPWHSFAVSEAMDEWAKQQSTAFLAWHTNKFDEYMSILNNNYAIDRNLMEEMKRFEMADNAGRYDIFIENQNK
ncbi:MAG TPA: hypothetical protein VGK39_04945 [Cyclobacteriaceae bacterium]